MACRLHGAILMSCEFRNDIDGASPIVRLYICTITRKMERMHEMAMNYGCMDT